MFKLIENFDKFLAHSSQVEKITMPELPEVETTLRGLQPHLEKQIVRNVVIRRDKLRWPIPQNLRQLLHKQSIQSFSRRGKYLLTPFSTFHTATNNSN